jgi:rhamnosyltransferase
MPAFVVAHYDPAGRVRTHLYDLVRALPGPVVFVSTKLSEPEAERIGEFARVVVRPNVGYDFLSYRTGVEAFGESLREHDGLVVFNSSFITLDVERLLAAFLPRFGQDTHLLGITHSDEQAPHLQSYWVGFGPTVVRSPDFGEWWAGIEPLPHRKAVILTYELGLSRFFRDRGFKIEAAFASNREQRLRALARVIDCPAAESPDEGRMLARMLEQAGAGGSATLDLDAPLAINPTHFMWDFLLETFGIVKLDLVRNEPYELKLSSLRRMCTPRQWALVEEALEPWTT